MSTARAVDIAHVAAASLSGGADIGLVSGESAPVRLRQALAQVKVLKQSLAMSRQESNAKQVQVEFLTAANAQLKDLATRHQGDIARSRFSGASCQLPDSCLSWGLEPDARERLDQLLTERIRIKKGDQVYRAGDAFNALYMIRLGSCKTLLLTRHGEDQISGYHMTGEIVGIDGIGAAIHKCQAVAVEATEVYVLTFHRLETFARLSSQFQHNLHRLLSDECARAQDLMILLGTMHADQRLAVFLLDLSKRYRARGYSSCEFVLRLTRDEIATYLGLKLETVSRMFSRFQHEGLIQVQGRSVKLLDQIALQRIVDRGA